jgi:hypothetical protein
MHVYRGKRGQKGPEKNKKGGKRMEKKEKQVEKVIEEKKVTIEPNLKKIKVFHKEVWSNGKYHEYFSLDRETWFKEFWDLVRHLFDGKKLAEVYKELVDIPQEEAFLAGWCPYNDFSTNCLGLIKAIQDRFTIEKEERIIEKDLVEMLLEVEIPTFLSVLSR